jgi:hypothetical protein
MIRMVLILMFIVTGWGTSVAHARQDAAPMFHEQVELDPIGGLAVHVQGRIKSFGSHANAMMDAVSGPKAIGGQSPSFTYLDMLFRPEAYEDADCIYVKNKLVRNTIADAVSASDPELTQRMDVFRSSGLVSPVILDRPEVASLLRRMESDLIRTAKQTDAIKSARTVMSPSFLLDRLRSGTASRRSCSCPSILKASTRPSRGFRSRRRSTAWIP